MVYLRWRQELTKKLKEEIFSVSVGGALYFLRDKEEDNEIKDYNEDYTKGVYLPLSISCIKEYIKH